ncbi:MAG: hypothetical protein AB8E82_01400 [Aureispira sp.]
MKTINIFLFIGTLLLVGQVVSAQQMGFGAKGGLLVGTQQGKRALLSYHGDLVFEKLGAWQGDGRPRRLGFVASLGYHRRGASYNAGSFNNPNRTVISDVFHNISLAALFKGGYQFNNFAPYYAGGLRLEYTMASQMVNPFDAQGVTPFNVGLWLGGGIDWEPPKLPFGLFIEISIQPDITPQIFFQRGTIIEYRDPFNNNITYQTLNEDRRVLNLCLELTFGIKFIQRSNQTGTDN